MKRETGKERRGSQEVDLGLLPLLHWKRMGVVDREGDRWEWTRDDIAIEGPFAPMALVNPWRGMGWLWKVRNHSFCHHPSPASTEEACRKDAGRRCWRWNGTFYWSVDTENLTLMFFEFNLFIIIIGLHRLLFQSGSSSLDYSPKPPDGVLTPTVSLVEHQVQLLKYPTSVFTDKLKFFYKFNYF